MNNDVLYYFWSLDIIMTVSQFFESFFFSQMWQFAPNSIHYLLSLWQRMVASVPYVKALEPHLLETYTPEVTQAFVTSRLESVSIIIRYVADVILFQNFVF